MKTHSMLTVRTRLYRTIGTLLFLFLIGLALTIWIDTKTNKTATKELVDNYEINRLLDHIDLDILQMSDGMRGFLLDTKNAKERERKLAADEDLGKSVTQIKSLLADHPDLIALANDAGDYDEKTLNQLEETVMTMSVTNAVAAIALYNSEYVPARQVELKMFQNFDDHVNQLTNKRIAESHSARLTLLAVVAMLIVIALILTQFQASAIQKVLHSNIAALQEVSSQVALAASSITTTSQTLADGSSQQAASIEETSASLEEMTSMTKRNAENSAKANDLARQTRTAADKGVADIETMSAAMGDIKNSSDDIAKIIRTIDEIAFQTNILALNAAVEAARAGEAGMGFAVVADEVRNLAQRSAQAAKETATKIESAIGNTARGVELSGKVAVTLNEIVAKAREMDELAAEVAGASSEQTQGISQVNLAVGQMDKVTQSNAASAEESAASAEELNSQATAMQRTVDELATLIGEANANTTAISSVKFHKPATSNRPANSRPAAKLNGNGHYAESKPKKAHDSIPMESGFRDF